LSPKDNIHEGTFRFISNFNQKISRRQSNKMTCRVVGECFGRREKSAANGVIEE
jgi:hypothetical protein